jgi:hypothetical protein
VALLIQGFADVRTNTLGAGVTATVWSLPRQDRNLTCRLRHLYLHATGASPIAARARLACNIPGLADLNGLSVYPTAGLGAAQLILPVFHDLEGDASGTIEAENLSGGALPFTFGFDGYYMRSPEDEAGLRPRIDSPSFVRASPTISMTTTDTEFLRFRTPNYRGGVVITGFSYTSAAASRTIVTFQGAGLERIGPLDLAQPWFLPIVTWLPPLSDVRVLMRRTVAASNTACALYGHGLP